MINLIEEGKLYYPQNYFIQPFFISPGWREDIFPWNVYL